MPCRKVKTIFLQYLFLVSVYLLVLPYLVNILRSYSQGKKTVIRMLSKKQQSRSCCYTNILFSCRSCCLFHLLDPFPQPETDVCCCHLVRGVDWASSAGTARSLHGFRSVSYKDSENMFYQIVGYSFSFCFRCLLLL